MWRVVDKFGWLETAIILNIDYSARYVLVPKRPCTTGCRPAERSILLHFHSETVGPGGLFSLMFMTDRYHFVNAWKVSTNGGIVGFERMSFCFSWHVYIFPKTDMGGLILALRLQEIEGEW